MTLQAVTHFAATTVVPYGWLYALVIGGVLILALVVVANQ